MEKTGKGYHKLIVWQKARELVKIVYECTDSFPKAEEFGLKGQIRRATVSVVLNIVEGYRRSSRKDYIHFLTIANGSLSETEAAIELAVDLQFLTQANHEVIEKKRGEVAYLLHQLIKSLKEK